MAFNDHSEEGSMHNPPCSVNLHPRGTRPVIHELPQGYQNCNVVKEVFYAQYCKAWPTQVDTSDLARFATSNMGYLQLKIAPNRLGST